jgi:prophage regulatory protein
MVQGTYTIWRRTRVQEETGEARSTLYRRVSQGLFPPPIRLGARSVGWPADEVIAVNAARIAGASPDEVRALVSGAIAARRELAAVARPKLGPSSGGRRSRVS